MQPSLFQTRPTFDGTTFQVERDGDRLSALLARVRDFLSDGEWHTLGEIHAACGGTEASCSARLRDLRKAKFGGYVIERQYIRAGVFRYRWVQQERG